MNRYRAIVALVVFVSVVLHCSGSTLALSDGPPRVVVEAGTVSGGAYQLVNQGEAPGIEMAGGNYRLQGGVQPMLTGSGCCCLYLPCISES